MVHYHVLYIHFIIVTNNTRIVFYWFCFCVISSNYGIIVWYMTMYLNNNLKFNIFVDNRYLGMNFFGYADISMGLTRAIHSINYLIN